jgi:hypothetical protein
MCFKKTLYRIKDSEVQVPCIRLDDVVFCLDAHLSSIIHSDDENFPFGLPSVSRSSELFKVVSVQTSQQHVRTPFNVRQVKGFPFQNTDMGRQLQPSRRRSYSVWTLSLIRQVIQKTFNRSDVSLHCPDAQPYYGNCV